MQQVVLGKSGLRVSAVGFGGIPIMRVSQRDAVRTIHRALELGVNFIDTAAGYADSQQKIGKAIAGRREGLVIASKSGAKTADAILADIDRARREMDVDCIDLYQLHGVSSPRSREAVCSAGGALEGLLAARGRGWIAHIGYSSHNADVAVELTAEAAFETVQFPFNMVTREPAEKLLPKARAAELGFIVMKPMCGGMYDDAELAFKFLNGYPDLVPIPGIERGEQIEQIVRVVETQAVLAGDDAARAEKIAAELGKQFCRRCGYCEPCPEGVPITTAMILESLARRMPREHVAAGPARAVLKKAEHCTECGECEKKCPYELPIIETIRRSLELARRLVHG
jgi:hypothetical protein